MTLLGVLGTPAVRRSRPIPPRPPRTGWLGRGHWQQTLHLRRRCQQRAAKRQSVVGLFGSPRTMRRRRRPHHRWSEGLVVVQTMHRPPLIGWPGTLLDRVSQKREHRRRPAGPGGGSPQPTVDQTCKCSTFVLRRFCFLFLLLLLKMLLCCLARRQTSTSTKSRSRGRVSLLPSPRHNPQSSLRRRPLLGAPRNNQLWRMPRRAPRQGMKKRRGPLPRVLLRRRKEESLLLRPERGGSQHRPEQGSLRPWVPLAWTRGQ